ncbi:saccharopine dehydrogenase [Streptomyces sp. NBC_00859]|uniref:saccharopine dehydrogenase n=1 Tax=Streptomyces sp. NBC_00859 TaxID=2903682 RepID=UPI00386DD8B4|nr:saccharopine dehydrogenase [Streptomyces sp. NBC_00859]
MSDKLHLWMRAESRPSERRAPLVPEDAALLVSQGIQVTVEESAQRAFALDDYISAGCHTAPPGAWDEAPAEAHILGLKELPSDCASLTHRHIYFGHAYKGQSGACELLGRFTAGGGTLLDLEYLTADTGQRLAAFGYWAGYVGAALAVLHRRRRLETPLRPTDLGTLDALLTEPGTTGSALVVGALGRSGRGACDALERAGFTPTRWDMAETADLDRAALLDHDILVNTVLMSRPAPPFLTGQDLDGPRRLSLVADVTCDVTSACNVLPVYTELTDWERPVRRLRDGDRPADLVAIDNLPSLLPVEASRAFSAELRPLLAGLSGADPVWARCRDAFATAVAGTGKSDDSAPHEGKEYTNAR